MSDVLAIFSDCGRACVVNNKRRDATLAFLASFSRCSKQVSRGVGHYESRVFLFFFFGKLLYHTKVLQLYLFPLFLSVGMDNFETLLSGAHFMVSEKHFSIILFTALVQSNFR